MDLQIRKLHIIEAVVRLDNAVLLEKLEAVLQEERVRMLGMDYKPMDLEHYEQRVEEGIEDYKNDRVTTAKQLKEDIKQWK